FHCLCCLNKYKCAKKNQVSNEERKKREREFEETGVLPQCFVCKKYYYHYKSDTCKLCCMINKCNQIECSNCKKRGIKCVWPFPHTEEEFKELEEKSITRSTAKFKRSGQNKLHFHLVLTFTKRVMMKYMTDVLKTNRISFLPGVLCRGSTKDNEDYTLKSWGRCKIHHKPREGKYCKCNLFVKEDQSKCSLCKLSCINLRKREQLDEEGAGPFIFGKFRYLEGSSDETIDKLNMIKLDNEYKKQQLIEDLKNGQRYEDFLKNLDKLSTSILDSIIGMKTISKDLDELENRLKFISEKRFYPKNFYFYGDSGSGKTTIIQRLVKELAKEREACKKANDPKYFDNYNNNEIIYKHELRKNKKPVKVVSKYNIFTAQDPFNNIFTFRKHVFDQEEIKSSELKIALYRRFSKSQVYTHGYIIEMLGCYEEGVVNFRIDWLKPYQARDLLDFINGRFDIKFVEDISLEEAKKYVYNDDFDNLYEQDGYVFMKREINMSYVLGGIVGNVDLENETFSVYNQFWDSELLFNILIPDNIESLHKNLQVKLSNFIELDPQIESSTKRKIDNTEIEDREKEKH
ncbi:15166_t:CDS:2, partial [Dentiscutata heterogama]